MSRLCECGCGREVKRKSDWFIDGHDKELVEIGSQLISKEEEVKYKVPHYKGGKIVGGGSYKWVFCLTPYRWGYELEHRIVMEEYLGRKLEDDEIVHHIDEIKNHNLIENLELCLKSVHISYHFKKYWA